MSSQDDLIKKLTWGCEIECFAAPKVDPESIFATGQFNTYEDAVHTQMRSLLRDVDFKVHGPFIGSSSKEATEYEDELEANPYGKWNITREELEWENHSLPDGVNTGPYATEIISPILKVDANSCDEVLAILQTLKDSEHGYHLLTNTSTGLHIHVGLSEGSLPFHVLKNLALIVVAFEDAINTIHSTDRYYNGSVRLLSSSPLLVGLSIPDRLQRISECEDIESLITVIADQFRYVTYNMTNFSDWRREEGLSDRKQKTIEFRQHKGTVDPKEILLWAQFLIKLVQFSIRVDQEHLWSLLKWADDPSFSILHLADEIGAFDLREGWKGFQFNFSRCSLERKIGHMISEGLEEFLRTKCEGKKRPCYYNPGRKIYRGTDEALLRTLPVFRKHVEVGGNSRNFDFWRNIALLAKDERGKTDTDPHDLQRFGRLFYTDRVENLPLVEIQREEEKTRPRRLLFHPSRWFRAPKGWVPLSPSRR